MSERLALKDDKQPPGGSILEPSSDRYNEDGRAFALAEDLAACGNCTGSWPIGGTARNLVEKARRWSKTRTLIIAHAEKIAYWRAVVRHCRGLLLHGPPAFRRTATRKDRFTRTSQRYQTTGLQAIRIFIGHRQEA